MQGQNGGAISRGALLSLLGDWAVGTNSLYAALADGLRVLIERGDIRPGSLLPAERSLAASLCVSRGTIMSAYEALRRAGLVESRQGSGSRVRLNAPRPLLPDNDEHDQGRRARGLSGRLFEPGGHAVDLAVAMLHDADDLPDHVLPVGWAEVQAASHGHGYSPQGLLDLRERIAEYYQDRGIKSTASQVVVTGGAQQGIDLCAALALRPGDYVLVESPTYPGALDTFVRHGARVVTIPARSHLDEPGALRTAVERYAPRLVYLMPALQNPTATVMSESRRREIAHIADAHQLYVLEDNALADVSFERRELPLLAAYSKQERVLTLGSLSKSVWGGLRVGWIRGDEALIGRLARIKAARDLGTSPLPQLVASRFMADLEPLLELRRAQLKERSSALQEHLAVRLPGWEWEPPAGGLSLWVRLPAGSADAFSQHALRHGVAIVAGGAHCADGSGDDHVRISFSHRPPMLEVGAARLQAAWNSYVRSEERGTIAGLTAPRSRRPSVSVPDREVS